MFLFRIPVGLGESFSQLQKTRGSHCSHQQYRGKVSEIVHVDYIMLGHTEALSTDSAVVGLDVQVGGQVHY